MKKHSSYHLKLCSGRRTGRTGTLRQSIYHASIRMMGVLFLFSFMVAQHTAEARGLYRYGGEKNRETIYGKITDQTGKPIHARVELWYAEIGPVEEEGGQPVPESEQAQRQIFHADFSNSRGWYGVEAFPGDWLLRITAGPEYSTKEFDVHVDEGELDGQRHDVRLTHLYDLNARGWYSIDVHHHSLYSDGRDTPERIQEAAKSVGLDAVALTDHNTADHIPEWTEYSDEEFLAVTGIEVTTRSRGPHPRRGYGHHNALGIDELPGAKAPTNPDIFQRYTFSSCRDVQHALDEAHAKGGLYMINHSMQPRYNPGGMFSCWGEVQGFDAIEIQNGGHGPGPFTPWILGTDPSRVTYWNMNTTNAQVWFEFLNAGNKLAGWGSSDSHDALGLSNTRGYHRWSAITGSARTYCRSGELSWPALKQALKEGKCFVSSGVYGLLLLVDSEGLGPGDEVQVGTDGRVPLNIEILANRPLEAFEDGIRIIQGGRIIKTFATQADQWTMKLSTEVQIVGHEDTWLVVQAIGRWPGTAMTNAIYLDLPPYGDWGSGKWTFPEGSASWNNPWPTVPEITVPDGPSEPPYPQPEAVIGYERPMTEELAKRLLREQFEILGIDAERK